MFHNVMKGKTMHCAEGLEGWLKHNQDPKALHPRTTSIPITVVQEWQQQQIELMALLNQSTGVDLSRTRVWNPLVKIVPMNLADCFAILTAHTERHLRQIAQRLSAAKNSSTPV